MIDSSARSVREYQRAFAESLGVPRAFAFWKGRVALYAILKALGIGEGDEVIMPGYTCVMAVNPLVYLGAKPVFVDIEPRTYNINPDFIEAKITPRTRLIIAQHTYGYPARMDAITDICQRHGLTLVEDCCLALGSRYKGKLAGTFGVAAYFSFQWNKPFTSGLGGMAVVHDRELADRIASVVGQGLAQPTMREVAMLRAQLMIYRTAIYPRTTAFAQNVFRWLTRKGLVVGSSSTCEFQPRMEPDFFKGMSQVQAHVGLRQLARLDNNIEHRRRMTRVYDSLLSERGWSVTQLPSEMEPVLVRYPVRVADKQRALAEAASHFVELGSWFECPLHPIETPMEAYGYHTGMCPEADRASRETVNLPLHPRADEATARRTVDFICTIGQA
ncbi:MAG TPA: DegT/DnrJ/EryC1/StrS family aminotransferase [Phycisphaerae bacterium]|nr:DegT/DnrJ/EryC1/StrS family aminotransferase [Phycisphaerae bacterium]HRR84494.1 DegT/DnrJ/EryC1/StrS family aminotransferase [Phycisphaerae bacterium]